MFQSMKVKSNWASRSALAMALRCAFSVQDKVCAAVTDWMIMISSSHRRQSNILRSLVRAEEVALADFDAAVAQDAVGDGDVEIEVRQVEAGEKLLARHGRGLAAADREGDVALISALEL